jgi:EmrB/QacA subfamily drug resistance transporter
MDERARRLTLAATVLGSSLAFLDVSVVVIALPSIERDLDAGLAGEQWIYLSYSLALASLYLVAGAVGDRRGRREVFIAGVVGFAAASVLAGVAPSTGVLIAARALQGIAGAFVTTNSLALLREAYGADAGRAIGLWTSFTGVTTIAGPPVGGALVEWVSWRWIFFVNLPVAAATVMLALAGRGPVRARIPAGHLDIPGAVLVAAGLGSLTYALVEGADRGLGRYWWLFALGVAALVAFVIVESRKREPMLPLWLFRNRNFAASNAETFLVYVALGGVIVYLAVYLQFLGFSAFQTSLITLPTSLVLIALSPKFGALADRHGPRLYLTLGPVLLAAGVLLLALINERSDLWTLGIPGLLLFSLGLAMVVAPITSTAISSAPGELAGVASGVNTTFSRVGQLLAVAVVGIVIASVFDTPGGNSDAVPLATGQHDPVLRAASIDGWRAGMAVVAGLALAGAAVGALGLSNREATQRAAVPAET